MRTSVPTFRFPPGWWEPSASKSLSLWTEPLCRPATGVSSDRVVKFVIPMGQGIVGYVAESKQALNISNVDDEKKHLKAISEAVGFEARNMVALPIVIRGRVFAVVELLNRVGEDRYTEADLELLKYVCEKAARACEVRMMLNWRTRTVGGLDAA